MSKIMMALVLSLVLLLLSAVLVHSDESMVPFRSFKISGNVTYDCVNIYMQPGLAHPLLKTHKIQIAGLRSFQAIPWCRNRLDDKLWAIWRRTCLNIWILEGFVQVSKVFPIVEPNDL
ncbi:unnamed protein product [Thlaspi arvense]|uniref:Uncharacterized protein n=1 Tax=Thlaspi arvense TaxID=13288 RepID=A0AAU9RNE5_THLAR|nr:unnamed protein product [Thlaspi arvense]